MTLLSIVRDRIALPVLRTFVSKPGVETTPSIRRRSCRSAETQTLAVTSPHLLGICFTDIRPWRTIAVRGNRWMPLQEMYREDDALFRL